MGKTPDQLKAQIERTRADLSDNVDVLADKVNPRSAARRTTDRARARMTSARDSVMGTAADLRDSAADAGSSVTDTLSAAPAATVRQTQGSPLTAGLVAFGVGALVASLMPSSSAERRAAMEVKDRAEPLAAEAKQQATQVAQNIRDDMQPQVQSAAQEVGQSAKDAAQDTVDEAKSQGEDVAGHARTATKRVRATRT